MSASLVGSEMCIRDRVPLRRTLSRKCRRMSMQYRAAADAAVAGSKDIPVSYTHLTLPTICSV
eukprot:10221366-Alexandrium_andersonii.AAC.1